MEYKWILPQVQRWLATLKDSSGAICSTPNLSLLLTKAQSRETRTLMCWRGLTRLPVHPTTSSRPLTECTRLMLSTPSQRWSTTPSPSASGAASFPCSGSRTAAMPEPSSPSSVSTRTAPPFWICESSPQRTRLFLQRMPGCTFPRTSSRRSGIWRRRTSPVSR